MSKSQKQNVGVFDRDAREGGGYVYADPERVSSAIANRRMSEAAAEFCPAAGRTILDLGCGDGTYTAEFAAAGAKRIVGIDPAPAAIDRARATAERAGYTNVDYIVADIYHLPEVLSVTPFDAVILRGVLHHLPDAKRAVEIAAGLADSIVIIEPNGANPVLKLLERFSSYHVEHEEQSFLPSTIDGWCEAAGSTVVKRRHINLVPMFCPAWMARMLKAATPLVEASPLLRTIVCGQYVVRADRSR